MSKWPLVPLGNVVRAVETWNPMRTPDEAFTYIDLSAVNNQLKRITGATNLVGKDAPSRARQVLNTGDVLVSTVRPNLNAVAFVDEPYGNAIGSTGFTVLRPNEKLNGRYLFHWVKSPSFVKDMTNKATGQSYPAVSDRIVKESLIPLPPMGEQRRIAQILDLADEVRTKRQATIAKLDELPESLFHQMFGDPLTNPYGFPMKPLGELGSLDRGVSKHRPRNDPALLNGSYPLIQTGDVANSGGYISNYQSTYSDIGLAQSKMWPSGTLAITIAANIAKTGILTFDACFPDSVAGFTADSPTVEYVRIWFNFLQPILEAQAPQSAQKNINLAILRGLEIPVPPHELQEQFADRITAINSQRVQLEQALTRDNELFAALQSRAFTGDL